MAETKNRYKLLPDEGAALKWQDKYKLLQILLDEAERETLTWFKWLLAQENNNQSKYRHIRLHYQEIATQLKPMQD